MKYFTSRPVRFVVVGGAVTLIDLGLTYLVVFITGTRIVAVSVGFVGGLISSYLLHAKVSFSTTLDPIKQLPRFATLVGLNYTITVCVVLLATEIFDLTTMTGKMLSLPVVAGVSFFASKHWVYDV